jgi:hypothetical protein
MARFKKGSREAKAWGRRMKALRGTKRKHPKPRKRNIKHRVKTFRHKIIRHLGKSPTYIAHPIRSLRHRIRRRRAIRQLLKGSAPKFPVEDLAATALTVSIGASMLGLRIKQTATGGGGGGGGGGSSPTTYTGTITIGTYTINVNDLTSGQLSIINQFNSYVGNILTSIGRTTWPTGLYNYVINFASYLAANPTLYELNAAEDSIDDYINANGLGSVTTTTTTTTTGGGGIIGVLSPASPSGPLTPVLSWSGYANLGAQIGVLLATNSLVSWINQYVAGNGSSFSVGSNANLTNFNFLVIIMNYQPPQNGNNAVPITVWASNDQQNWHSLGTLAQSFYNSDYLNTVSVFSPSNLTSAGLSLSSTIYIVLVDNVNQLATSPISVG